MTEHLHKALVALDLAERTALQIRRDLRARAVKDQLALTTRSQLDDASADSFRHYLWLPAWTWMLVAVVATVVSVPIPSLAVAVAALVAALVALMVRTALTIRAAPGLFAPAAADVRALNDSLADADRHLHAEASHDPYRAQPPERLVDHPGGAERPWTMLPQIRTAAAAARARARALPPGTDST